MFRGVFEAALAVPECEFYAANVSRETILVRLPIAQKQVHRWDRSGSDRWLLIGWLLIGWLLIGWLLIGWLQVYLARLRLWSLQGATRA
jgi:hypothetical protein